MPTGLKGVAAKARENKNLVFTSLAHHITKEMIWENLKHIPKAHTKRFSGRD